MIHKLLIKATLCFVGLATSIYSYLAEHNRLTRMRMEVPALVEQIRVIEEENTRLCFEIEQFENPWNLMTLAKRAENASLHHPLLGNVAVVESTLPFAVQVAEPTVHVTRRSSLFIGAGSVSTGK